MQIELCIVASAAILGLLQIVMVVVAGLPQRGLKWDMGPRDGAKPLSGVAARIERASINFFETFPVFVAVVLVAYLAGKLGDLTQLGAVLYLAGRILYVPLYAFGIPVVRTVAWSVALLGIVLVLIAIAQ